MAQTTIQGSFLGDATVTGAKIGADFISAQTALTTGLATTDEIIVSDAGVIKRMDISVIALSAAQLTSGTIPDARFPATLPAISGANLTGISAGISFSGSTANGMVTYGSASSAVVESAFTFDGNFAQITGNFNNYSDGPLRIKTTNASGYCPISFYSNDDTLLATFRPQVSNGHLSIASAGNINFSAGDANADAVTHMKILTTGDITLKENNSYNISIPKGLAKLWCTYTTSGTVGIVGTGYNVASVSDGSGTGEAILDWTGDFENEVGNVYAAMGNGGAISIGTDDANTAGGINYMTTYNGTSASDQALNRIVGFGEAT